MIALRRILLPSRHLPSPHRRDNYDDPYGQPGPYQLYRQPMPQRACIHLYSVDLIVRMSNIF